MAVVVGSGAFKCSECGATLDNVSLVYKRCLKCGACLPTDVAVRPEALSDLLEKLNPCADFVKSLEKVLHRRCSGDEVVAIYELLAQFEEARFLQSGIRSKKTEGA